MSFLGSLRQQPSENSQNLELRYLFSHDTLQLYLRKKPERGNPGFNKAYALQRQHLTSPPAFISETDQGILQNLHAADQRWLNQDSGQHAAISWKTIEQILKTERAELSLNQSHRSLLKFAEAKQVSPYWFAESDGSQQLRWQLRDWPTSNVRFAFIADGLAYIISQGQHWAMGLCERKYEHHALPWTLSLDTQDIEQFRAHEEENWQRLSAPLPEQKQKTCVDAELKPLLFCDSSSSGQKDMGRIQLLFSLSTENFCSLPSSQVNDLCIWDGMTLWQLGVDQQKLNDLVAAITAALSSFVQHDQHMWYSDEPNIWRDFFKQPHASLETLNASIIVTQPFSYHYLFAQQWHVSIDDKGTSSIDVKIQLRTDDGEIDLADFLEQLQKFNRQTGADEVDLRLADGRILLIENQTISKLLDEFDDMAFESGGFALARSQLSQLASLSDSLPGNTQWSGEVSHLNDAIALHRSPIIVDKDLSFVDATLRSYQWLGVSWIHHLKQHRYNGLLADDMGLGKTLQTLAYLGFEKQQDQLNHPALILVPLSLVHNWSKEIEKFTPGLSYKIVHGSKRHDYWPSLQDYDILITTYHSLASDLSQWHKQTLSWLILDEAQNIKNPDTKFSRAAREINCAHKLCLSGTPVENHLGELWSIMSFLMPGCLGTKADFKRDYRKPIEEHGDGKRLQKLLKRIAPFMLRRTKEQIAQDLPEKTELTQLIPLSETQQRFYDGVKQSEWSKLTDCIDNDEQKGKQHIAALTALMALRQACCDPELLEEVNVPSAKRSHCIEMVTQLVAENRSVLIFSQFTRMLDILEQSLTAIGIHSLKLTGSSRHRQTIVDDFQNGAAPVFLISLKAGGAGLNLTRADTVIHYDPWWNNAAERQASDRAHRIGQDKPVFVYKLIAENTVEEKIAQLQNRKASLSDHVDNRAQLNAETFALTFEELLKLWQEDKTDQCV